MIRLDEESANSWATEGKLVLHRINNLDDSMDELIEQMANIERAVWAMQSGAQYAPAAAMPPPMPPPMNQGTFGNILGGLH